MDIVDIAAEAVRDADLISEDQIYIDRFPDSRVTRTSLLIAETNAEYEDSFASPDQYGFYRSTLQIAVVSNESKKAKRLCRTAAEIIIQRFDELTQPYTGPIHGVERLGKENGTPNDPNYQTMFAAIRTVLVIHQFEDQL
ncbi:MAG: hypothetical protein FWC43_04745 [Planctomycetaceae bacterium]|nr:hypothetical protein [Planctomycetaceae bacterium]